MHIVIIGDAFPPMRTSGAVMLRDLSSEFTAQGDTVTAIIPSNSQTKAIVEKIHGNLQIIYVKAFKTKDTSYLIRTFSEFVNPFLIWIRLRNSKLFLQNSVNLVVWYSPSIFWGPLVKRIKKRWGCQSYLILRDIFPDWASDLGLLSKHNPALYFFRLAANYQYQQADAIGVQSPNNISYLLKQYPKLKIKLGVLWNWMHVEVDQPRCSIRLSETSLSDKKVFVYAGNIGVAQGISTFLNIIEAYSKFENVGFLFVGRGSEMSELKRRVSDAKFKNVLFYPEIPPEQINDLYVQCHAGIVVLDGRHRTHNIPGKFVSYMHAGLPVFGIVNLGNDLINIVRDFGLGYVGDSSTIDSILDAANLFIYNTLVEPGIKQRCKDFGMNFFGSERAVDSIKLMIQKKF